LGSELDVKRLVYGLFITRQLETGIPGVEPVGVDEAPSSSRMPVAPRISDFGVERISPPPRSPEPPTAAPVSPRPPEPPPPEPETPESAQLRQELERLAKNEHLSHYEVLGVPPRVSADGLQKAFFALAKQWHPDRLAPELAHLRELA